MQWSADPTEHAHIQEIKIPARAGNNQDYYSQIARHLDHSEKCLRFDIATHLERNTKGASEPGEDDDTAFDQDDEHKLHLEDDSLFDHLGLTPFSRINYFEVADAISRAPPNFLYYYLRLSPFAETLSAIEHR
ncbi:hypothetical protein JVU11DRAFT_10058 [Chiua virens]|nr:hypothetical protein JVU11DRAFT_10058 [Chiua virens]